MHLGISIASCVPALLGIAYSVFGFVAVCVRSLFVAVIGRPFWGLLAYARK
jgi:hypothetical protein